MRNLELLAPAGSYEALVAAVQNGADAIYLGGNQFSARAYATNFSNEELTNAVEYAHLRNVKIYVTINTLYEDCQFKELYEYLSFLYYINVDAVIVQDVGTISLIKKYFPDMEIHMSTQASIYQVAGVQYFERLGIQRVVLSRENTLEEIRSICQSTKIDIEVFVHGALCVSYSGQCLMSSYIGKRSGNKGSCAQPCRLGYTLLKDGKQVSKQGEFLLSPKDLCTIENIAQLIEAGVTSFKIEGRMKRPEYVATIISSYRQAIDAYINKKKFDTRQARLHMKSMFNRGFTKGYLFQDSKFMSKDYPGNRGIEIGEVINYNLKTKKVTIKLRDSLKQNDRIVFKSLDKARTITKLYKHQKLINQAHERETIEIKMDEKIPLHDIVYKIIDSDLLSKAKESYRDEHIKVPITMTFNGRIDNPCTLVLDDGKYQVTAISESKVEKALQHPLSRERIQQQIQKLGSTVYQSEKVEIIFDANGTIPIKEINTLRRKAVSLLDKARTKKLTTKIQSFTPLTMNHKHTLKGIAVKVSTLQQLEIVFSYPTVHIFFPINDSLEKAIELAHRYKKEIIPYTGFIMSEEKMLVFKNSPSYSLVDSILIGNYGAIEIFSDKKCILDTNMNVYNSYASNFFKEKDFICSLEMTKKQVNNLQTTASIYYTVYGRIESMISKYCPISEQEFGKKIIGCNECKKGEFALLDRKQQQFPMHMDDDCYLHLYNSKPLYIDKIEGLHVEYIMLSFTIENEIDMQRILDDYFNTIWYYKKSHYRTNLDYTNGYYERDFRKNS